MAQPLTPWEKKMKAQYETTDPNKILKILARSKRGEGKVGGGRYTAKSGDNLFSIAENLYGDQRMAYELARANGGSFVVRPGDTFKLPTYNRNVRVSKALEDAAAGIATVNGRNISGWSDPQQAAQAAGQTAGAGGSGYVAHRPALDTMGGRGNPLYGDIPQSGQGITPGGVMQEDVFWWQRGSEGQRLAPGFDMSGAPADPRRGRGYAPEGQLGGGSGLEPGAIPIPAGAQVSYVNPADPRRGRGAQGQYTFAQPVTAPTPMFGGAFERIGQGFQQLGENFGIQGQQAQGQGQQPTEQQVQPTSQRPLGRIENLRLQNAAAQTAASQTLNAQFSIGVYPDIVRDSDLSRAMPNIPKDFQAAAMAEAGYTYNAGVWTKTAPAGGASNVGGYNDYNWNEVYPRGMEVPLINTWGGGIGGGGGGQGQNVAMSPYYTNASLMWRAATG